MEIVIGSRVYMKPEAVAKESTNGWKVGFRLCTVKTVNPLHLEVEENGYSWHTRDFVVVEDPNKNPWFCRISSVKELDLLCEFLGKGKPDNYDSIVRAIERGTVFAITNRRKSGESVDNWLFYSPQPEDVFDDAKELKLNFVHVPTLQSVEFLPSKLEAELADKVDDEEIRNMIKELYVIIDTFKEKLK